MSTVRNISLFAATVLAVCAALVPAAQASWSAPAWTTPTTTSQFSSSACTSTTFCILAGYQAGGTNTSLVYRWNGTSYSALTSASTSSELYGVNCTSTTHCLAVGTNYSGGTKLTHAQRFNGTTWTNTTTTTPASSTYSELRSVSCQGLTSCVAVGHYETSNTTSLPLIEAWNGTGWATANISLPGGGTSGELQDVSCSTTTTCTAVGWYDVSGQPRRPLVHRLSGATWATQTAATPAGATLSQLQGVACTTNTTCDAVGLSQDSTGTTYQHSLAQHWDGSSWTLRTVADPSGGVDPGLSDISCYSSTGCVAVGTYSNTTTQEPLAAVWNGSTWTNQSVPKATGVSDASLAGVSCPTSTTCRAVGVSLYSASTNIRPAINVGP
jgi:hypothetical protein